MMKAADEGKIDLILTKSIKRFARNTVDLLSAIRHLKEIGVEVRFEQENISTTVCSQYCRPAQRHPSSQGDWR